MQSKVLKIITDFLNKNKENYKDLQNNFSGYKNIFQYVYSNVFPEIYCSTERCGFDSKSNFHIIFKTYNNKKQLEISLGKNPENYEIMWNETLVFEQKSLFDKNLTRLTNNAAAKQKSQTDTINLIDDILDEDNPFKNIDTKNIWIEDHHLFDNEHTQTIKNVSKEVIDINDPIEAFVLPDEEKTSNL